MPLLLLLGVGFLIAVTVNLAKAAGAAGIVAPEFAFWLAGGAGLVLLAATTLGGARPDLSPPYLLYYAVTGLIGVAAPNYIGFEVARHAGAAYASVPYALSPLFTYLLAILCRLDAPSWLRITGLVAGCIGTMLVVADMIAAAGDAPLFWLLGALAMPLLVAVGNVYRTLYWPGDAAPMALAAGMLIAAALWLLPVLLLIPPAAFSAGTLGAAEAILATQVAVSSVMYWLYFRLQRAAGPVYLSQIGYVAAGFGVVLALIVFGERISLPMLAGMVLIVVGVVLVTPRRQHDAAAKPR